MDDRQTKIREGAGLEDSRINQEFVDFLNKWSSPVLIVLAVAALIWAGRTKLEQMKNEKIDNAFSEYEAAMEGGNPAPTSLTTIADSTDGIESVSEMARLRAVDIYLGAYTLGLEPGAQLIPGTLSVAPGDVLDEERREQMRSLAEMNASQVLESTKDNSGKAIFALQALSRLASIEESKGDFERAKGYYEQMSSIAQSNKYPSIASFVEARIAGLDELGSVEALPSNDQVPALSGLGGIDLGSLDSLITPAPTDADEDSSETEPASEPAAEEQSASATP